MKKIITGFILGVLITGTIGVMAANTISSSIVTYNNKTVEKSLDELYDEAITGKGLIATAITNKGVSTNSDATYQTMATNISSIDTDHSTINQKIANLETKHNTDITTINNTISNLNKRIYGTEYYSLTNKYEFSSVNNNQAMKYGNTVEYRLHKAILKSDVSSAILLGVLPSECTPLQTISKEIAIRGNITATFEVGTDGKVWLKPRTTLSKGETIYINEIFLIG